MMDVLRRGQAFGAEDPFGHVGAGISFDPHDPSILHVYHRITTLVAAEAFGLIDCGLQPGVKFHGL